MANEVHGILSQIKKKKLKQILYHVYFRLYVHIR